MGGAQTPRPLVSDTTDEQPAMLIQILTTEEFVLQSTRASTISESSSRATIFLGSVSSGLIAIALTAQLSRVGNPFYVLALTVLPTLVFLGLFSYVRVMQTGIEDLACAYAIERIRSHYRSVSPHYATVMPRTAADTTPHLMLAFAHSARWQLFFTAGTMISSVTSVLVGASGGLALSASGTSLTGATALAIPLGAGSFALLLVDQRRRWMWASSHLSRPPTRT